MIKESLLLCEKLINEIDQHCADYKKDNNFTLELANYIKAQILISFLESVNRGGNPQLEIQPFVYTVSQLKQEFQTGKSSLIKEIRYDMYHKTLYDLTKHDSNVEYYTPIKNYSSIPFFKIISDLKSKINSTSQDNEAPNFMWTN